MKEIGQSRGLDNGHTIVHTNGMKIAISIPDSIFHEVKRTAEEQKRSRSEVIVEAVSLYLKDLESRGLLEALDEAYSTPETEEERETGRAAALEHLRAVRCLQREGRMVILQGDIFWFDLGPPARVCTRLPAASCRRPKRCFQQPVASETTGLVCPHLQSRDRAKAPGQCPSPKRAKQIFPGPSVVNISQIFTADKSALKDKIGTLSRRRVQGGHLRLGLLFRRSRPSGSHAGHRSVQAGLRDR